ncbi:hypothetical protein FDZ73_18350 [bacterium]|nr:MAG: hypothetical protein FDZ73_18350 [bacterium]
MAGGRLQPSGWQCCAPSLYGPGPAAGPGRGVAGMAAGPGPVAAPGRGGRGRRQSRPRRPDPGAGSGLG